MRTIVDDVLEAMELLNQDQRSLYYLICGCKKVVKNTAYTGVAIILIQERLMKNEKVDPEKKE